MDIQFEEYLIDLGMKGSLTKKVEEILQFFEENFSEKAIDIFVEEYIKEDGSREYESLQFYSEKLLFEARNFRLNDDFAVFSLINDITFIRMNKENYDFKNANEDSRFTLSFGTGKKVFADLKSSKKNCDQLKKILFKYIRPNLIK